MGLEPRVIASTLIQIKKDIDSNDKREALKKTDKLLNQNPCVIEAIVIRAKLLLDLKPDNNYKKLAAEACVKATKLLVADFEKLGKGKPEKKITTLHKYMDTLQTLKSVCESLNQWKLLTLCYESASQVSPEASDLFLVDMFECYFHQCAVVKQRKIASRLSVIKPTEKNMMGLICTLQFEAHASKEDAISLLEAAVDIYNSYLLQITRPINNEDIILIYMNILEQLKDFSSAVEMLSYFLRRQWVCEWDGTLILGRLLALHKKYEEAAEVFKNLLTTCPDDWECFQSYISCLLEDATQWSCETIKTQVHPPKSFDHLLSHLSDEVFDSRMETASDFVRGLISKTDIDDTSIRSPHLALVEIQRKKVLRGRSDTDALIKALSDYFCRFGHLACCVLDAESSLQVLTKERIRLLVEIFESVLRDDDLLILAKKITLFKLQELCELSLDELESNALTMTKLFTESLELSENSELNKNMHGEDLLSLASNALVRLFWRTQCLGYLLEAVLILEFGLTVRRCVPQFKILLVHLYSHLGAYKLAYDWYKSLGFEKSLLLETASHHILPQMLSSPFLDCSSNLLKEYLNFMEYNILETANSAIYAYHSYSYSTMLENFLLKDRLQHSQNYLMARLEANILQLKQKTDKIEDVECVLQSMDNGSQLQALSNDETIESLTVNDDMQTRPWWSPSPDMNYLLEPFQKNSTCSALEDKNQRWLQEQSKKGPIIKAKLLIPRMIWMSFRSASAFLDAEGSTSDSMFSDLVVEYAKNLGMIDSKKKVKKFAKGKTGLKELVSLDNMDWLCFAVFLTAQTLGSHKASLPASHWNELDSLFRKFTEERIISEQHLIAVPGVILPSFVQMVTEPLSWHCLVLQWCTHLLVLFRRKKKKGRGERAEQLTAAVASSIVSLCGTIELVTKRLRELESEDYDFNSSEGPGRVSAVLRNALMSWDEAAVLMKVRDSQKWTLSEFLNICEKKLTLLKKLMKQLQ